VREEAAANIRTHDQQNAAVSVHVIHSALRIVFCNEDGSIFPDGAVREGIDNLTKALQLRPDYDDAMAYLNLMYRERADIQCTDPAARSADLKTADEWVDKTMATKKAKAEKQPGGAIVMDQNK